VINASVWDDDGNAFFMLQRAGAFCKVSVGSDGSASGLVVEIFQQHGLDCAVVAGTGGHKHYALALSVNTLPDGSADCDSTTYDHTNKNLCPSDKTWRAPRHNSLHQGVSPSSVLWTARIALPPNVSIRKVARGGDSGYGVDLKIGGNVINASVWDDDGNAFFMLQRAGAFCKVSVGSDGSASGLVVEIFQQHGLDCAVVAGTGGHKHYALALSVNTLPDGSADCDSTTYDHTNKNLCPSDKTWRAPRHNSLHQGVLPSSVLWTARIALPPNVSIRKVPRGGDSGYGVDLKIDSNVVDANVWDDDGNAFFMLQRGEAFCKVSVGSDGLAPGLVVEIFQQHSLDCTVVAGTGGPKDYALRLSVNTLLDGSADCDSTSYDDTHKKKLCPTSKTWRAPKMRTPQTTIVV